MSEQSGGAEQPWRPADATRRINEIGRSKSLTLALSKHAREQMAARGLIVGDVLDLLKNGFVYAEPEPATRPGFYKYALEGRTPNSAQRKLRAIIVPDANSCSVKLVTLMWVDES